MALSASTRGTNTSIKFDFANVGISVSEITDCIMTVRQGKKVTEHPMEDLAIDTANNAISYLFSQAETLEFNAGCPLTFELHFIINGLRYKSRKTFVSVDDTDLDREMDADPTPPTPSTDWEALYKGAVDRSISSLVLPSGLTEIGASAFFACSNLTQAIIPESVTAIKESAFSMCSNLEVVDITDNVTEIGPNAFRTFGTLQEVHIRPATPPTITGNVFAQTTIVDLYLYGNVEEYQAHRYWSTILNQAQNLHVIEVT